MKEKRSLLWRWCPQPERVRATRTRPTDRPWIPLIASALILSLLAIQGAQMWAPAAVSTIYPNSYSPAAAVQPFSEIPTQTTPASQTVTSVSTSHFTVQFTFPESADPANTIAISITTTAKSSGQVDKLSIEVFAYVNRQLAKATSTTVLTNKQVRSGNSWQTTLAVAIPANADRSVMVGIVTETWEETSGYYNSNAYFPYYQSYPYYSSYPYYPSYPYYGPSYLHNATMYYVYEPSYVTVQKSSQQTLPLTYVLATTPEYEQLSAQDKALRQEYDSLLAKHNELSSQYEALRSDHDQLTSKYNQLASVYAATSSELNNFRNYTYVLIVIAIGLAAAVAFLALGRSRTTQRTEKQNK